MRGKGRLRAEIQSIEPPYSHKEERETQMVRRNHYCRFSLLSLSLSLPPLLSLFSLFLMKLSLFCTLSYLEMSRERKLRLLGSIDRQVRGRKKKQVPRRQL